MLEPIQGEAGVFEAGDDYLRALRALTAERGILLIADEIQTGIGRTGRFFGYQHAGIEPDIVTVGKGLGGGVPLAALVASERVSCFEPGDQGGVRNLEFGEAEPQHMRQLVDQHLASGAQRAAEFVSAA
jgi:acetylornithine/N-succinyldiaminopimelate aminotransferase